VHVAANHRARPDARILANHHVADDNRGGVDVSRSRDLRLLSMIRPDVGLAVHLGVAASFVGTFHSESAVYRASTENLAHSESRQDNIRAWN